jgi:hypothetical protein
MKKENITLWVVGLAVAVSIGAMFLLGGTERPAKVYSASALEAMEMDFDFGNISMKDGNVSHSFEVINDGEETVVIEKVYTSCMCTQAVIFGKDDLELGAFGMQGHGSPSKTSIEVLSGERVMVSVIYDPNAHGPAGVGLAMRSVYLETNSAKSPKFELQIKAMVTR